jgi:hypothetical protein
MPMILRRVCQAGTCSIAKERWVDRVDGGGDDGDWDRDWDCDSDCGSMADDIIQGRVKMAGQRSFQINIKPPHSPQPALIPQAVQQ